MRRPNKTEDELLRQMAERQHRLCVHLGSRRREWLSDGLAVVALGVFALVLITIFI